VVVEGEVVTFTSEVLEITIDGEIATLWLNRPQSRNALGHQIWHDLPLACDEIAANSQLRVLVIGARGPHFSVGLDLKEMGGSFSGTPSGERAPSRASTALNAYQQIRYLQDAVTAIADLKIPVIAAVHGYCIGGGVDIICTADIRLAASDAIFSVREAKVAIVADLGTLQRLPRIVSEGHVAELAFTGKDIDAARAAAIGLVNHVHEGSADEVMAAAMELAREIAANSPLAVKGTKAVLRANEGATVEQGLEFVAHWNSAYLQSNDLVEAMTAFMERRPATFTGS
jgi:enoyl-CoA hydratase